MLAELVLQQARVEAHEQFEGQRRVGACIRTLRLDPA